MRGLTLVVGDSGIGKSSFLANLVDWTGDPLVSRPIVLKAVQGSLQTAVAHAISDCLAQFLSGAADAEGAWAIVKAIAERAGRVTGREIGRAIAGRALEFAESKLGAETVELGRRILGETIKGGSLGFDDQLAAIKVPDRAEDLAGVAAELSEACGRPIVLLLDNAERLAPPDHGLLAELSTSLRGDVRMVVCVTPHQVEGDEVIRLATARGATRHTLHALSRPGIESWLADAGVPMSQWDTVIRISSGYPFFIAEAVRLSASGTSLNAIGAPNGFESLMRESWTDTPANLKDTIARLAPFVDPPSDEFLAAYLGFDDLKWGIISDSLLQMGIFVQRSDGRHWFHDRRRDFIWGEVLTDKQRGHVGEKLLLAMTEWIEGHDAIDIWIPTTTALLARAVEKVEGGDPLRVLFSLSDGAISLLWGLIEVLEPHSALSNYAEISEVVRHSETRSRRHVDPLESLTALEDANLVAMLEQDDVRLVRLTLPDNLSYAALLGEIHLRFHATPRPRLASAAFDYFVRPHVGSFDAAVVSLGRTRLSAHKAQAKMLRDPKVIRVPDETPGLGATILVDGEPVSFTASFTSAEQRSGAEEGLRTLAHSSSRVQLERTVSFPARKLRYARYGRAVELLGVNVGDVQVTSAEDIAIQLDLGSRWEEAFRTVSSTEEAEVLGLGRSRYLLHAPSAPDSWTAIELETTQRGPTTDVSHLELKPRDPLLELRLRAAGILEGQGKDRQNDVSLPDRWDDDASACDDPENDRQGRTRLQLRAQVCTVPARSRRTRARDQEGEQAIVAAGVGDRAAGLAAEPPYRSVLVGLTEDVDPTWFSDFGSWSVTVLKVDNARADVAVRRVDKPLRDHESWPNLTVPKEFEAFIGARVVGWQDGDVSYVIAPMLGYNRDDARMTTPNSELGRVLRSSHHIVGEPD